MYQVGYTHHIVGTCTKVNQFKAVYGTAISSEDEMWNKLFRL